MTDQRELKDLAGFTATDIEGLRAEAQRCVDRRYFDRALILLDFLTQLNRSDPQPQLVAIDLLATLGRGREAETRVVGLLRRFPENPDALVLLARLHLAVGNLHRVAVLVDQVMVQDPTAATPAGRRARAVAGKACAAL